MVMVKHGHGNGKTWTGNGKTWTGNGKTWTW